jgi:hypothetical protein
VTDEKFFFALNSLFRYENLRMMASGELKMVNYLEMNSLGDEFSELNSPAMNLFKLVFVSENCVEFVKIKFLLKIVLS